MFLFLGSFGNGITNLSLPFVVVGGTVIVVFVIVVVVVIALRFESIFHEEFQPP